MVLIDAFDWVGDEIHYWVYDSAFDTYQMVPYDGLMYYSSGAGTLLWNMTFTGLRRQ